MKILKISGDITLGTFASLLKLNSAELIKKLFLKGQMLTINSTIPFQLAEELAMEYDILVEKEEEVTINFGDKLVYNNGNLSVSGSGIFSGSVYANAGNFSGSITASSGKIGMWNIDSWGLWGDYGNGEIQLSPSHALFWDLNSQNYIYIPPQYGFQLF